MNPVAIGIDLGGTNCRAALVDDSGTVGEIIHMPTPLKRGYGHFLEELVGFCRRLLSIANADHLQVVALGMGTPGIISVDGLVATSPNLAELNGKPLARDIEQHLPLPVRIINDANAIGWGEALFGAGQAFDSFLTMTLGTGVGGALVLNRKLWAGIDGAAGEVGHLTLVPDGRPCGCGNRGCLEQYASAGGIVISAQERLQAGQASVLRKIPVAELTSRQIAEAAAAGDPLALAVFSDTGRALGQILAGIANLLNLDGVVIGGGVSASLDLLLPSIHEEIRQRAFAVPAHRMKIVRGELGERAGILGAAGFALQ